MTAFPEAEAATESILLPDIGIVVGPATYNVMELIH